MTSRLALPAALLLAAGALPGCTLIDQHTFAPEPDLPAATQVTNAALPEQRDALVTIRYDTASPAYADALNQAIGAAEARTPNLEYDVVAEVPQLKDPQAQTSQLAAGQEDAADVMRTIMDRGIPDTRIRLFARIDPLLGVREVRVYVR
jgi:ABC-type glycerol-3-phosphate transport system substrate-binding protein